MDDNKKMYTVDDSVLRTEDGTLIQLKYVESCYSVHNREYGDYINIHTISGADHILQRIDRRSNDRMDILDDIHRAISTNKF